MFDYKKFKTFCEEQDNLKPQELADIPRKPSKNDTHWGYHLLLDVSSCNKNIDDAKEIRSFLKELVEKLDMTPVGEPIVKKFDNEDGRGYSAIQLITTSTITFHGDDERMCIYLDVFSCKAYEPKIVFDLVHKYFNPKHIGHKWIYRDAGDWPERRHKAG